MNKRRWKNLAFWVALAAAWAALGWVFYHFVWQATAPGADGLRQPLRFVYEGRDVEVLEPLMLGLILLSPILWAVRRYSLSDLPRVQQHLSALLRALLIAALALALSRVVFTSFESHITTVFLVDTSASMPDEALAGAQAYIQEVYDQRGVENDVQIITFAERARVLPISPGAQAIPPIRRPDDAQELLGSNLQDAMRLAYGLFPQDHIKRVVLISDGNQTSGDLLGETYNARDYGIKVFAKTFPYEPRPEVLIKGFQFPEEPRVGEPFTLTAEVYATREAKAKFALTQNDLKNGEQEVTLQPGLNNIEFKTEVFESGVRRYALKMTLEGGETVDTFAPNNSYQETIEVKGKPRVLYVEGQPSRGRYLVNALAKENIDVEMISPAAMPSRAQDYENIDAVVLSDVPAHELGGLDGKLKALDSYVSQKGGGFIMVGGENSFGPGGYQNTRMEQMLPVTLDGEKNKDTPSLALELVVDKSGSMKGQKMEMAKEAAKATVEVMQRNDKVGVIAFDDGNDEIVPLQSAANRLRIVGAISRIQPSGGTNIAPALQLALTNLLNTRAALKHIILLTDGQAPQGNIFTELIPAMELERITISTVGVSREADQATLRRIATSGGGRFYFTTDPESIPRIFTKETSTVTRSQLIEEPFRPRVARSSQAIRGLDLGGESAPVLLGYVSTKAKNGAEVILTSPYGEPILARWRRGLGKTAVFTSDVKNRWGAYWVKWDKFPKFWAQVLRDLMRTNTEKTLPMELRVDRERGLIVVDAINDEDRFINGMKSAATIKPPEGEAADLELQQTAPGRYEGRFDLKSYGSYIVQVNHTDADGDKVATSAGTLTWPYPDEYLTLQPNEKLIAKAAEIGRGQLDPTAARLFDPEGESVKYKSELWPWFLFGALGIFVLDILLRRLRLYGKTAIPWEQVAGRG
jgi:Ca-activated chloride channel family protein